MYLLFSLIEKNEIYLNHVIEMFCQVKQLVLNFNLMMMKKVILLMLIMLADIIIRSKLTKLLEMTVTRQLNKPSTPIITATVKVQQPSAMTTQRTRRKINSNVTTKKTNTPKPKVYMSFSTYVIMSSAIIGTPPK